MKKYKVIVTYGDGKPKEDYVIARCGIDAQDKGHKQFPGARVIHIVGSEPVPEEELPHPLFRPEPAAKRPTRGLVVQRSGPRKDARVAEAIKLRHAGWTYKQISEKLLVSETTVRNWINPRKQTAS